MTAFDKLYEKTHPVVEKKVVVKESPVEDIDETTEEQEVEEVIEEGDVVTGEEPEEGEDA